MFTNVLIFTDTGSLNDTFRPAGAYKAASILRSLGYETHVNFLCTEYTRKGWLEVAKKYKNKNLIWVGFSTTFLTMDSKIHDAWKLEFENPKSNFIDFSKLSNTGSKELIISRDKERIVYDVKLLDFFSDIFGVPIVLAGTQLTRNSEIEQLRSKKVIFFPGYGEEKLKELTESIRETSQWTDNRKNVYEFDREKFRRESFIWTTNDDIRKEEWLPLEINRGCAFKCAYCTYDHIGQRDHYKLPETLLSEIIDNNSRFGTEGYFVLDDLYNDSQEKVLDLYNNVFKKLNFQVEWNSYIRLDLLWRFPDQISILRNSGLRALAFGIETLNDKAGKLVGKGLGKQRIIETLKKTNDEWKDEILKTGLWIAGLPYEPKESWQDTFDQQVEWDYTHSDSWQPLYINRNTKSLHRSAIDKNYEKFGYVFDDNGWKHEMGYTEYDAKKFCEATRTQKPSIGHFEYGNLRGLGYSHNDIMHDQDNILKKTSIKKLFFRRRFNKNFIY
jgi:radical SAM superfamily enzyme YgiQ (UPF0313 family)